MKRTKDDDENQKTFAKLIDMIPAGKQGVVLKESPAGKLISEWKDCVAKSGKSLELVDISAQIAEVLAPKDFYEMVFFV